MDSVACCLTSRIYRTQWQDQNITLSQTDVQLIGTAANLGGNIGIHIGLIYDAFGPSVVIGEFMPSFWVSYGMSARFATGGVWWKLGKGRVISNQKCPVKVIAGILGLSGWIPMWAILYYGLNIGRTQGGVLGVLCFLAFLQGHSQQTSDLATVPTMGRNFPNHRGLAIGLMKSFVGLSGAIAAQFYQGLFEVFPLNTTSTTTTTTTNLTNPAFLSFENTAAPISSKSIHSAITKESHMVEFDPTYVVFPSVDRNTAVGSNSWAADMDGPFSSLTGT